MGLFTSVRARLATVLSPVSSIDRAWWPVVREPYTGAWQNNDPLTVPSALLNPSVFAVVSRISSDIGKCAPPLLLERDANGFWDETTNSAYSPVLRKPNPYQTAPQFYEQLTSSLLLDGNAYALTQRDDRGVVNQLHVLDPCRVKVLVAPDGSVYYELQANDLAGLPNETPPVIAPARAIMHLRWNCWGHPLVGMSPLVAIAGAVNQAQAIQSSSTNFFASGGRTPFVVTAPTKLDPLAADRLKTEVQKFRSSGTMILEGGLKSDAMPSSASDMQLIAQLGWTEETIAKVFGMPISIINSSKQPPYANAEASQLQYISNCLQVHFTSIATGLTDTLGLPLHLKVEFDDTLITWMDTATRTKAARDAIISGMSPNEVRETYYDLGPVDGGALPYLQQQNKPVADLADPPEEPTDEPIVAPPPREEEPVAP